MNKIIKGAIGVGIVAATSAILSPVASAATTYVYNKPTSNGALYAYSGSGCTGTATYIGVGQGKTLTAKSYVAHWPWKISWNGGAYLGLAKNKCFTVNAGSVTAIVNPF